MISIILSSYNQLYFEQFVKNVEVTIGVEFEIIQIENHAKYSICEAYNIGAIKAKNEILIFCHEDMIFKTQQWGVKIIEYFKEDKLLGAIGFAGSSYLPYIFTGWGGYLQEHEAFHLVQHHKFIDKESVYLNIGSKNINYKAVVALDGFFIATTRAIWEKYRFDDKNFTKFHFYDVDFTLRVSKNYNVKVIYDVITEHFSDGNYNREWLEELNNFNKKWSHKLPISLNNKIEGSIDANGEYRYLRLVVQNNYTLLSYFNRILSKRYLRIVGWKNLLTILLKFPIRFLRLKNFHNN
ncbi:glycosyltransferase [Sphingobacterium bovistauri]|uniref:Streptomycin biosynthesis protein StrF domain-containing protein n=1 Tax=Sphingobacterium bovistauri TaxID=2781959 RepID=A0ABS7Z1T1_9SPHI|nr:glycosyltransferase [Sphingobacterium bovistauri]MCA5004115.1 hypothetical protein [Sphingobacterium bovistauri]